MLTYSTIQVAELLGITSDTLHRWIREGKVKAPPIQALGGMRVRMWSEEHVEAVRKYKAEHYRKKPNRKKRRKSNKQ
jgi:excisionase family DNA binding protein